MSFLYSCHQDRLVKRAYRADRVQALGWGAAIEDKLNPLGQSLAAIDEPFDCSLATSAAAKRRRQLKRLSSNPATTTSSNNTLYIKLMLGWSSICNRSAASSCGAH